MVQGHYKSSYYAEHEVVLSQCVEPLAELLARPPAQAVISHPQPHSQQPQQQQQQTAQSPTESSEAKSASAPAAGDTSDQRSEGASAPAAGDTSNQKAGLPGALTALHLQRSSDEPALETSDSAGGSSHPDKGVTLDPSDTQQLEGALQLEVMHALLLLLQPPEVPFSLS